MRSTFDVVSALDNDIAITYFRSNKQLSDYFHYFDLTIVQISQLCMIVCATDVSCSSSKPTIEILPQGAKLQITGANQISSIQTGQRQQGVECITERQKGHPLTCKYLSRLFGSTNSWTNKGSNSVVSCQMQQRKVSIKRKCS